MSKRVIFFGNERLASGVTTDCPILRMLIEEEYDVKAIVVNQKPTTGRSKRQLEIINVAREHDIEELYFENSKQIIDYIDEHEIELGVLVAFGRIIKPELITALPHGIINIHPSKLPQYRGPTPIETAILDDTPFVVSIMALDAGMDTGPVYSTGVVHTEPEDTKQEIADKIGLRSAEYLRDDLPDILKNKLSPAEQSSNNISYTPMLSKDLSKLKPTEFSATELTRQITAYAGWPGSKTTVNGVEVAIIAARVVEAKKSNAVYIDCKNNTILEILELQPNSGKAMTNAEFLRGRTN